MTDNEFLLYDRIEKIKSIINQYGEDNFYVSFSGGKDSTVLSALIDMALPDNKIPRVYADTGIEFNMIRNFVRDLQKTDDRVVIIKPSVPIKAMLEKEGYPFKSKEHSAVVASYQGGNRGQWVQRYLARDDHFLCPQILRYQFTDECTLKISDKCCLELKEKPISNWQVQNKKPYGILGILKSEGGRRSKAGCLSYSNSEHTKLKNFQPLVVVTKEWEDWFISTYNIKLCDIYMPPYNFTRTGCKGCPFNVRLKRDLDVLETFFPNERKQCEIIWKPVYDEYRRLGYRLDKDTGQQTLF